MACPSPSDGSARYRPFQDGRPGVADSAAFGVDPALAALAGMFIGQALRQTMSVETFRKVFFVGLLALGGYLVLETAL